MTMRLSEKNYSEPDPKLSAFYEVVIDQNIMDGVLTRMEGINRVCWAYLKLRIDND